MVLLLDARLKTFSPKAVQPDYTFTGTRFVATLQLTRTRSRSTVRTAVNRDSGLGNSRVARSIPNDITGRSIGLQRGLLSKALVS